jgi:hypothetical protein
MAGLLYIGMQQDRKSTILIEKQTIDRLRELGRKGETYDDIINRLVSLLEVRKSK